MLFLIILCFNQYVNSIGPFVLSKGNIIDAIAINIETIAMLQAHKQRKENLILFLSLKDYGISMWNSCECVIISTIVFYKMDTNIIQKRILIFIW